MPLGLHWLLNQYFLEMCSAPLVSFVNVKSFTPVCKAKMFAEVLGSDAVPRTARLDVGPVCCVWPQLIVDALEKGQPFLTIPCGSVLCQ